MIFQARSDLYAVDICDADFVLARDGNTDLEVDHELPPEVVAAINVLRAYAAKIESVVA
jgi:hypothetical protein